MFRRAFLVLLVVIAFAVFVAEIFKKSVKRDAESEAKAFAEREGRWP